MENQIKIRQATSNDVPKLYTLMNTYIVDFYHQPKPNEDELKGLIQYLLDNPTIGLQFVAEKDDDLFGFATLYFTFSTLKVKRQAILNDLFVVQDARGQKIGEELFKASLSYIRDHDFSSMTWETAKDNTVAQSLYEKMGSKKSPWLSYEIR